jgi:hypothetical protein
MKNGEPLEVYHHTDNPDLVVVNNLNFIFLSIDKQLGIKTKAIFMLMRMMQKANFGSGEADKKYWEEKGWLGKNRPWK